MWLPEAGCAGRDDLETDHKIECSTGEPDAGTIMQAEAESVTNIPRGGMTDACISSVILHFIAKDLAPATADCLSVCTRNR